MAVIGERLVAGGNGGESVRSKSIDMLWLWKVFGSVISVGSGQIATLNPFLLFGQQPVHL